MDAETKSVILLNRVLDLPALTIGVRCRRRLKGSSLETPVADSLRDHSGAVTTWCVGKGSVALENR